MLLQVKQLKQLKYESLDYGPYENLKKTFFSADFEPEDVEEIDLSHEKAPSFPNKHCLEMLKNLSVLIISNNKISRFPGTEIARVIPKLQVFDISYNLIEDLDDFIDMGGIEELRILDFVGNYVCTYVSHIDIIENLLCPKKYLKYNPVRVLTAGYNQIPVARLSEAAFEQQKKDRRVIERFPSELRPDELINTVSKFNHKNTLGKYSLQPCPIPRKTRFKNLQYLNRQAITKLDIIRVTGVKNFKDALVNIQEQKVKKKQAELNGQLKKKSEKLNQKAHNEYLRRYIKKIKRIEEGGDEINHDTPKQEQDIEDPDELLAQLTKEEKSSKKEVHINPKKYSKQLWETPLDMKYKVSIINNLTYLFKDAEFAIGIQDFKKQEKEYKAEKLKKIQQRKLREKEKRRERQLNRRKRKGLLHDSLESVEFSDDTDDDPEIKKLFRLKTKPVKPKMNLSKDDSKSYRSSESSLQEKNSQKSNTWDRSLSKSQGDETDRNDEQFKRKKIQFFSVEPKGQTALELRKKLLSSSKKNETKVQSLKVNKRPENIIHSEVKLVQSSVKLQNNMSPVREAPQQPKEQLQDIEVQQFEFTDSKPKVSLYPEGPSMIYSYGQANGEPVFQVQQFRMGQPPLQANRVVSAGMREQTKSTFSLKNKLSAQHQVINSRDIAAEKDNNLKAQVQKAKKQRQELEDLHKNNEALKVSDEKGKKDRPVTSVPIRTLNDEKEQSKEVKGRGKNFWREMERVKVIGDLTKQEYTKVNIPIEKLLVTAEQGVPEELRRNYIFNENNEKYTQENQYFFRYKEIVHYKKIMEESRNIMEAAKEMDKKVQIQGIKVSANQQFKASDYNTVFEYLKNDPKFQIQSSYDPGDQIVQSVVRKRRGQDPKSSSQTRSDFSKNHKISTFEMREIIYGANEYDYQKEKKIDEKEIKSLLESEKVSMEQRMLLYNWIEILDNINLKQNHIDEKRLERKEIERAQSFAHLANHYQRLKKYVPDDKLQKYVKLMGINFDEIMEENDKATRIPPPNPNFVRQTNKISSSESINTIHSKTKKQREGIKSKDMAKHLIQLQEEKSQIIQEQKKINDIRLAHNNEELLDENGYLAQNHPNVVQFLKEKEKQRNQVVKPPVSFEEMVEHNLRKLEDQFQRKGQQNALSLEDQMKRYANEFNEKVKNRERLKANMKIYIEGTQKKIDEFWQWEAHERNILNDKNACFKRYVKLVREGQIKII